MWIGSPWRLRSGGSYAMPDENEQPRSSWPWTLIGFVVVAAILAGVRVLGR